MVVVVVPTMAVPYSIVGDPYAMAVVPTMVMAISATVQESERVLIRLDFCSVSSRPKLAALIRGCPCSPAVAPTFLNQIRQRKGPCVQLGLLWEGKYGGNPQT